MATRFKNLLLNSSRNGLLLHDAAFRFISVNPTACAMLGYTEDEMLRMGLPDIEPDFDIYDIRRRLSSLETGQQLTTVGKPRCADGSHLSVEVTVTALQEGDARVYAVDLCPRGPVLPAIPDHLAHELNNAASVLLGLLPELEARQQEQTPPNHQDINALSLATRQILAISNALQQRSHEQRQCVSLPAIVSETLGALAHVELKNIAISHLQPQEAVHVLIEPTRIERVLMNLLRNAASALTGTDAPQLVVSYALGPRWVCCRIQDNGPGIPARLAARIFQPGVTTHPEPDGHGYGLSIAHEDVRICGGHLSTEPSETGACFTVSLPRYTAPS